MNRLALAVLVASVLAPAALPAARGNVVECTTPDSDEPTKVPIPRIRKRARAIQKLLNRKKVHILDLGDEALDRRRRLPEDQAAKEWCRVLGHVTFFEDTIANVSVDEDFVTDKLARAEGWLRAGRPSASVREKAARQLAEASAALQDGNVRRANDRLNRTIRTLFSLGAGGWEIPPEPIDEGPEGESDAFDAHAFDAQTFEVETFEVEQGCPSLKGRQSARRAELNAALTTLKKEMDGGSLRLSDWKRGRDMAAALAGYQRMGATWPAMRVACAMLHHVRSLEIDLGFVQGRFARVRELRTDAELDDEGETRFKQLVRDASDELAASDFASAHTRLEELLVLLGAPERPSEAIK